MQAYKKKRSTDFKITRHCTASGLDNATGLFGNFS